MISKIGVAFTVTNDFITSNARAWWSADSGMTTDQGRVTQWTDKNISSNLTPIGSGTGAQPTYVTSAINGLPGVQFVSSRGTGLRSPNLNLNVQPFSLVVVFRYDGVASNNESIIVGTDQPFFYGQSIVVDTSGLLGIEFFRGFTYISSPVLTVGSSYLSVATWTNNRYKHWINNTLYTDVTYTSQNLTGLNYLTVGADPNNNYRSAVTVCEVMVFNNRSITDAERLFITNSLNSKYSIF